MLLMIALLIFCTLFIFVYLILNTYLVSAKSDVEVRLKSLDNIIGARSDIDEELSRPFRQRVFNPLLSEVAALFARLTPKSIRRLVEQKLITAGGFGSLGPDEFLLLCAFFACSLPALVVLLTKLGKAPANKIVGLSIIAFAVGLIIPFIMLRHKVAARKKSIQKDLPDVLDLLTVSVEAGLGFDRALSKLTEKMKGALVEEFSRVLQEMRIGVPRRESLLALGARCDVPDLSLFATSLVQADQLGVSIGNVLRVQSAAIREKRRQRAQESAMKAPIKMMLPLVLFIFPTIFIILLGPAAIQVMTVMFK